MKSVLKKMRSGTHRIRRLVVAALLGPETSVVVTVPPRGDLGARYLRSIRKHIRGRIEIVVVSQDPKIRDRFRHELRSYWPSTRVVCADSEESLLSVGVASARSAAVIINPVPEVAGLLPYREMRRALNAGGGDAVVACSRSCLADIPLIWGAVSRVIWRREWIAGLVLDQELGSGSLDLSLTALSRGIKLSSIDSPEAMPRLARDMVRPSVEDAARLLRLDVDVLAGLREDVAKHVAEAIVEARIRAYLSFVPYLPREYGDRLAWLCHMLSEVMTKDIYGRLSAPERAILSTGASGTGADLERLEVTFQEYTDSYRVLREGKRWRVVAPWMPNQGEGSYRWDAQEMCVRDIRMVTRTKSATWEADGVLKIQGHAYIRGLGSEEQGRVQWTLDILDDSGTSAGTVVDFKWFHDVEVDYEACDPWTSYADSNFVARVFVGAGRSSFRLRAFISDLGQIDVEDYLAYPKVQPSPSSGSRGRTLGTGPHGELIAFVSVDAPCVRPDNDMHHADMTVDYVTVDHDSLLMGGKASTEGPQRLVLVRSDGEYPVGYEMTSDGRWLARIDLRDKHLENAGYFLRVHRSESDSLYSPVLGPEILNTPEFRLIGTRSVRVTVQGDSLLGLTFGPAIAPEDATRYGRQLLIDHEYGRLRHSVYFESFNGRNCGDSPRALFDALVETDSAPTQYWGVKDGTVEVPPNCIPVTIGSREWFEAINTSKVLVTNNHLPLYFNKRPGQYWIQTWHGAPLKGMVLAAPRVDTPVLYRETMRRQAQTWDLLLAQDNETEEILRDSFEYQGKVHIGELPRNRRLFMPHLRQQTRHSLDLDDGTQVVLFAPTWRKGSRSAEWSKRVVSDAGKIATATGARVLLRLHHMAPRALNLPDGVIDVTDYPFIEDLMSIADVMVSDYSSAIVDFELLERPAVSFVPDRAHFEDLMGRIRRVPEPLARAVHSTDELITAIRNGLALQSTTPREFSWSTSEALSKSIDTLISEISFALAEEGGR